MLPKQFIVDVNGISHQATEVFRKYYTSGAWELGQWNYVIVDETGTVEEQHSTFTSSIISKHKNFPVYTYEQWKKEIAPLPKKWIIEWKSLEIFQAVSQHFYPYWSYTPGSWVNQNGEYFSVYDNKPEGYEEITFEQFKTHVLKQNTMAKKIIGYKAPFAINPVTPKGTLYVTYAGLPYYCPQGQEGNGSEKHLAKQIVETWEPVYEVVEEVLTIGSREDKVTIGQNKIDFGRSQSSIEEVNGLIDVIENINYSKEVGGYTLFVDENARAFRLGCDGENHLFSLKEFRQVKAVYNEVNGIITIIEDEEED